MALVKFPGFVYHRPTSLDEAVELIGRLGGDAKVLAGGQSLLPVMALRLGQPEHLVDISRVSGLDVLAHDDGVVRVGARVTHAQVEDAPMVRRYAPLLADAMPWIAHRAVRNRGTVCGSLAHADPAAELPAIALALDASLVARSVRGERIIAACDFFEGFLTTSLAPDELLCEVRFPVVAPGTVTVVSEVSRRHGDYAMVGLAASLHRDHAGTIDDVALALFAVGSTAVRATKAEDALRGRTLTPDTIATAVAALREELDPPGDNHASPAYRRHVAGVVLARTLQGFAADAAAISGDAA